MIAAEAATFNDGSVSQTAAQLVAAVTEFLEDLADGRVIHRPTFGIVEQVLLADVGDVAGILVFREEVIVRLLAAWPQFERDRLVPFLAVGEDRIDVENDAAEVVLLMANNVANRESRPRLERRVDDASGLWRKEGRSVHDRKYRFCAGAKQATPQEYPQFPNQGVGKLKQVG